MSSALFLSVQNQGTQISANWTQQPTYYGFAVKLARGFTTTTAHGSALNMNAGSPKTMCAMLYTADQSIQQQPARTQTLTASKQAHLSFTHSSRATQPRNTTCMYTPGFCWPLRPSVTLEAAKGCHNALGN